MNSWHLANMLPTLKKWLQKYSVYPHFRFFSKRIDVIARKQLPGDNNWHIIAFTLRKRTSLKHIETAELCGISADSTYLVVLELPKNANLRKVHIKHCEKYGVGLLRVEDGEIRIEYIPSPRIKMPEYKEKLLKMFNNDSCASKPKKKQGRGPALRCLERLCKYRKKRPNATWIEMWKKVPNHYGCYRSLSVSMKSLVRTLRDEGQECEYWHLMFRSTT